MKQFRIAVVDDFALFRQGVATLLERDECFTVVGQGGSGREAFELARKVRPDLILLDMSMPDGGMEALREIKLLENPPLVAMLTVAEAETGLLDAFRLGADGYILKGIGGNDLVSAVKDLAAGKGFISPCLAAKVLQSRGEMA